jgi:hypothetical protein
MVVQVEEQLQTQLQVQEQQVKELTAVAVARFVVEVVEPGVLVHR